MQRTHLFLSLVISLLIAAPAAAQDDGSGSSESNPCGESDSKESGDKEGSGSDLKDIFTQPLPGTVMGPSWLDEVGDPPRKPPGRARYRIDAPLDVLYLVGGRILRGHLIKEDFPDHVAITMADGTVEVVPERSVILRKKEKALLANRINRSHRGQFGFIFAPVFTGGVCLSFNGNCPVASGAGDNALSGYVEPVPLLGKVHLQLTYALSGALEIGAGADLYRDPTSQKWLVNPNLGFRYYTNVFDPVKFVRALEVNAGFKPFSLRIQALGGFQIDFARNVGVFGMLGPELQVLPTFTIGFAASLGIQARFP